MSRTVKIRDAIVKKFLGGKKVKTKKLNKKQKKVLNAWRSHNTHKAYKLISHFNRTGHAQKKREKQG
ncbi:MAG: hypothetical protein HQL50_07035 [Magnetococcales bacterium]|nr:hypothetical protein [Magnetococcales bacterium]